MPIKSLFVPPQAIQGEDIPAHILWQVVNYNSIVITLPEPIKLKELYNVDPNMFKIVGNEIVVERVAVDGYLGMLFSTVKLKECFADVEIGFSFVSAEGEKIVDEIKKIRLFRPELEVGKPPKIIEISLERSQVLNRIRLRKLGQGTLIINFNTPEESDVQRNVPDGVNEFLNNVKKDLETNFNDVKSAFPQYSNAIDQYTTFVIAAWNTYTELSDLKRVLRELYKAVNENENFANSFMEAIAKSIIKNVKLLSLPETLLKYLDSVASKKVWLVQPWQVIPVSKDIKTLVLEILPTDLLLDRYDLVRLPPIRIRAQSEGYIEIARLFEWR